MSAYLRIVDWDDHYEINRTRELKKLEWVPIPNKHDGRGYSALVDHPDGPLHFAAWIIIVQIASKTPLPHRGSVVRIAKGAGLSQEGAGMSHLDAISPQDLARMSRMPAGIFEAAIPRLIEIGWLEWIQEDTSDGAGLSQEGAGLSQEGAGLSQEGATSRARVGREGKGREGKGTEARACPPSVANPPDGFDSYIGIFLAAGKKLNEADNLKACREWVSLTQAEQAEALRDISATARSTEARFIPMPVNHLTQKPWTRRGPERLLPPPKTAREQEFDRLFDAEFGTEYSKK